MTSALMSDAHRHARDEKVAEGPLQALSHGGAQLEELGVQAGQ
eukprot:CAMPEP_0184712036 /NCGR_PEP_ID=MMETSP0314-20130426/2652_1 /TAXON_ID=38298 /ORGANISM="Rhodella maculata, Strain CCMP 736" /LENGTH=42 /DNA_ID= /DNA_START= /DNA_END= /DNA_ORIENTATION=